MKPIALEKMHKMVEAATDGLAGVSASQVEIQSGIQFYDGITTQEIQEILIRSASDLIDLDHPNYQFVDSARLLLFATRKSLYGRMKELPHLVDHINSCVVLPRSMIMQSMMHILLKRFNTPISGLITIATSCLHMQVFVRLLTNTWCRIVVLDKSTRLLSSCT